MPPPRVRRRRGPARRASRSARRTSRCIRGGLPSSTSSGMSTGRLPKRGSSTTSRSSPRSPRRRPRRGSARARRSRGTRRGARPGSRARSAPAPRSTRSRAGTCPAPRSAPARRSNVAPHAARVDELGQRVRQPAGADVVDRQDRVALAQLPAAVDHLLRAALDLGVAALHRVEVERLRRSAPAAIDEAAPPPMPISMPGPPSWMKQRARRAAASCACAPRRCCRSPPAIMIGLW